MLHYDGAGRYGCRDVARLPVGTFNNFYFTTEVKPHKEARARASTRAHARTHAHAQVKLQFIYKGTEVFSFKGDDDVWVCALYTHAPWSVLSTLCRCSLTVPWRST